MDIRQQQFTVRMFRGFDVQEVDTFLEDLAGDYEAMLKENTLLKEHLQASEERTGASSSGSACSRRPSSPRSGWSRR